MRLIDADALKKDDELTEWITRDTIRTGKMLKAFSELFIRKIDDAPTVNAVSEEVYTREYNLRKDAEMKAYKLEKALEQEPKWIPVSERLPEERDWYLAIFKEKDTGYQLIPRVSEYIGENKWRIIDEEAFVKNYMDILKCVAWMPLPEPYKTESEVIE